MKIICDCGNEMKFNTKDRETGAETEIEEDQGQYARFDESKFSIWQSHDVVGITCNNEKCKKGIWVFV